MRSVTVGTSTSAFLTVSASSAAVMGLSWRLSCVSNSSRMRVSTLSGSLRVTTTSGLLRCAMVSTFATSLPRERAGLAFVQVSLTAVLDTGIAFDPGEVSLCNRCRCEDKGPLRSRPLARADPASMFRRRGAMNSTRNSQIARYACAAALSLLTVPCVASHGAAGELIGPKSGLPMPRFVSLKPDRVNVRGGPTRDHEVMFVYTRAGLPVEITAESDNWRRIRDWEGS